MDIMYQAKIEIDLIPIYHDRAPEIMYGIDEATDRKILSEPSTIAFDIELAVGPHAVILDLVNKTNADTKSAEGLDMLVTISEVRFSDIALRRFILISEYTPIYPEPWYSNLEIKPDAVLYRRDTLGWNGRWKIPFENPIFPWIHQIEKMGWLWPI
jgi:hypothetical protein